MLQNSFRRFSVLLLLTVIWLQSFSQEGLIAKNGLVVSAKEEASQIGVNILKKGGNAFDAMIATHLALAVAYPYAGNISGGGFMTSRTNDGTIETLDFRETAPSKAHKDLFIDDEGNVVPGLSTDTALGFAIPGSVAALFEIHKKKGTLPLSELFIPAIELAKKGVVVTPKDAIQLEKYHIIFKERNLKKSLFAKKYKAGDTIKYFALAKTLQRILENGYKEFYQGKTSRILIKFVTKKGGIVSNDDFKNYNIVWRKPISFKYKELTIHSMGLPSSGGITLLQILKTIENFPLTSYGHNSPEYIQLITEASKRAFADRNYYLGDSDFTTVPVSVLIDSAYIKKRFSNFSWQNIVPSTSISHGKINNWIEKDETTHYSIVDSFGNAVSVTTTLNGAYGSKIYCDELGFFLNNEMDDFSAKPGVPNYFGLVGAKANSIAPQKRMLSSMTPTIVEKNNKLFMVLGSPGGSTIITSVLQNILNVYEFRMQMQQSVSQPRFHHQHLPDEIMMEPKKFSQETIRTLLNKGYNINENWAPVLGKVDAILLYDNGFFEAGADPRGDDKAIGY